MLSLRINGTTAVLFSIRAPTVLIKRNPSPRIPFRINRLQARLSDRQHLNQAALFRRNPINQALQLKAELVANPVVSAHQVNLAVLLLVAEYDI
jgi:hypothetical protein